MIFFFIRVGYILDDFFVVDCGGIYMELYGIIWILIYFIFYYNEVNCIWLIIVVENRVVDFK